MAARRALAMRRLPGVAVVAAALAVPALAADPFEMLRPEVVLSADDRRQLERGDAIARSLPSDAGDLGVFSTVAVSVDGARLASWIRQIAALKQSRYVLAIRRFSDPPVLSDLDTLTLPDRDVAALRSCRPDDCDIKLAAGEIAQVQAAVRAAGRDPAAAIQQTFRQLVLARAAAFRDRGDQSLRPAEQQKVTVFLARAPWLSQRLPEFSRSVAAFPGAQAPGTESFLYWANEQLAGRQVVTLSHVMLTESRSGPVPEAFVVSRQIFVTRYVDVGVAMTMVLAGERPGQNALVYLNRTSTDVFDGLLGGMIRPVAQRRVRNEAVSVLGQLRERLQNGPPPERQ